MGRPGPGQGDFVSLASSYAPPNPSTPSQTRSRAQNTRHEARCAAGAAARRPRRHKGASCLHPSARRSRQQQQRRGRQQRRRGAAARAAARRRGHAVRGRTARGARVAAVPRLPRRARLRTAAGEAGGGGVAAACVRGTDGSSAPGDPPAATPRPPPPPPPRQCLRKARKELEAEGITSDPQEERIRLRQYEQPGELVTLPSGVWAARRGRCRQARAAQRAAAPGTPCAEPRHG
jgi:hypothetical protein